MQNILKVSGPFGDGQMYYYKDCRNKIQNVFADISNFSPSGEKKFITVNI